MPLTRCEACRILGVDQSFNKRELVLARNRLMMQTHPDRPGGDTKLTQSINEAYNKLLDGLFPPPSPEPAEGRASPDRPPKGGAGRGRARSESCEDPDDIPVVEHDEDAEVDAALQELPPPPGPAEGRASPDRPPKGGACRGRARSEAGHEENEGDEEDAEDAEDDASNSETEVESRPPKGGAAPQPQSKKRKRKSGGCRRGEAAAQKKDAGYVDRARRVFRDNQGPLATGTARTCLRDALWMALVEAGCEIDLEDVSSIMPEDKDANTRFVAAQDYAEKLGFELACVSSELQKKGGFEYNLLLRETGLFLVQLRVTTGKDDPNPDLHVCFFNGKCVRDNNKYTKVKKILTPTNP